MNRVIMISLRLYDNHKMLLSRYIGYFYNIERMSKASVILSYIFPIHDLIAGWGVAV